MPDSYLVKIEANKQIIFPKQCAVCGESCDQTGKIRGNPDVSYFGGWKYLFGFTKCLQLFIHRKCNKTINSDLRYRNYLLFGLAAIALPIVFYFDLNRLYLIILVSAFMFPEIYRQIKNPPPIEFVNNSGMLEFTIKNERYATKLAQLNRVLIERQKI